ncbi:MAG: tRNA (N(6)-L-threonylcarbamoyladenosine(37)-C(2))-methylthiotransferase MtaB [Pseudomonadota bacterium]
MTDDITPPAPEAPPGPEVRSLGCRLNAYEAEVMRRHAQDAGLSDSVIINTCAVTADAVRQSRQTIRRARRDNPHARVIVTGCAAQTEPETFTAMEEVDHVIGNAEKMSAATFGSLATGTSERVLVDDIMAVRETAGHLIDGFATRARAYVQVQNGCDHRCTFCIIPYGRGNSRSVPAGEVVAQIRRLVDGGVREVVLTGVDITSYGPDLPGNLSLGRLVQKILRHVPDLARLRLSSIDSIETDDALFDAIASDQRVMPHLHLSLQAGDDMVLKRMKRRHLRDDAIAFCNRVRDARPDVAFGADLIAGFPTETDAMFENSLRLVEECGLTWLHVFPYSPRKGTPAARMPQVARPTIAERAARLRQLGSARVAAHLDAQIGLQSEVLIERPGRGRTRQFAEVDVNATGDHRTSTNDLLTAEIVGHDGHRLRARIAAKEDLSA